MKRARVRTVMVAVWVLGLTWSPSQLLGQCCGDCDGDGVVTVNELVTAVNRALTGCANDRICSKANCVGLLAECLDDLTDCRAHPGGQRFPASGQITDYGTGSDGDVQAGATLSYIDNGDGTITDNNTGLMWEKKDQQGGGIHDWDNTYSWGEVAPPYAINGTIVHTFLAALNTVPCFAGHCDWRIPNVKELQSLVNFQIPINPMVDTVFNTNCMPNCTVDGAGGSTMCSCTQPSGLYWSSTTYQHVPNLAWLVGFDGTLNSKFKSNGYYVRAVRGGL